MARGELIQPGVQVLQTFEAPAPTFVRPTLAPCIVGPAFEVIPVLTSEGAINSNAKYGEYAQIGKTITQSSFPDHRGNIDELDILEETIRPFLLSSGELNELLMNPGESFLMAYHQSSAAAIQTAAFNGGTGLAIQGTTLVLAIDQPVRLDRTKDVVITFTGSGNLTSQQCADQINAAVGKTVATVIGSAPTDKVQITSPTYGGMSSVTVRAGGSANTLLQIGFSSGSNAHEERIEGSGFAGQDDSDNDTLTPWIEFRRGDYILDGVSTAIVSKVGLVNVETLTFVSALASAVTFGSSGTIPINVGDLVYGDGQRVKSGEVMKVESGRFRLGTINTTLSTADSNGRYTAKVYDPVEVDTLLSASAFAPKYVYFRAANLDDATASPTAANVTGPTTGTAASAATLNSSVDGVSENPFNLTGLNLQYVITIDGVETSGTFVFTNTYADMTAVAAAVNIPGVTASRALIDATPNPDLVALRLVTVKTGRLQAIKILKTGTANAALGYSTSVDSTAVGHDVEFSTLAAKNFLFKFDDNPHVYTVTFTDPSLDLAVDAINAVVGATVASKAGGSLNTLKMTSPLKGKASSVTILAGNANSVFGFTDNTKTANGASRPFPDAYLDDVNNLVVGSQILRDVVTGYPLDFTSNKSDLYVQFKALRKDVSAVAQVAGVLRLGDQTTLSTTLDPLTEENPLGLAVFLAMLNCPGFEAKCLGVDEVSAGAPEGTEAAYARALGLLEAEEIYAMTCLTQNEVVHGAFSTHTSVMSAPEQGGERIVFINKVMPTSKNPVIALSGTQANSTATQNQLQLDGDPTGGLVGAGVPTPVTSIAYDEHVYVEVEVDGELRRYNVSGVTGALVNFRTTFSSTQNLDGFYTTTVLSEVVINAAFSVKVRGDSLIIPGSSPERFDYGLMAEVVAEANESFHNRRLYSVFPDTIKTMVQGVEKALPGYYACAAICGMVAAQPPQQPFTNFPITGITGVVGTEKFSKKQRNIMAGGGTYILQQDTPGGAVFSRHQLSTDLTSIETRELSITKVVDFTAKFLRLGVRKFIGVNVIDQSLLDAVSTAIQGMLAFLVENGVLNGATMNNLVQDSAQPDTILVDITLDVPFPCNYIRLTLVV